MKFLVLFFVFLNNHNLFQNTVKPVLSDHSKIDKTKILMTNPKLMNVESIAEFCNTLTCIKPYLVLKTNFCSFLRVIVLDRFYCNHIFIDQSCKMVHLRFLGLF